MLVLVAWGQKERLSEGKSKKRGRTQQGPYFSFGKGGKGMAQLSCGEEGKGGGLPPLLKRTGLIISMPCRGGKAGGGKKKKKKEGFMLRNR